MPAKATSGPGCRIAIGPPVAGAGIISSSTTSPSTTMRGMAGINSDDADTRMASLGHISIHARHSSHNARSIAAIRSSSFKLMAPLGQASRQVPHPVHRVRSMVNKFFHLPSTPKISRKVPDMTKTTLRKKLTTNALRIPVAFRYECHFPKSLTQRFGFKAITPQSCSNSSRRSVTSFNWRRSSSAVCRRAAISSWLEAGASEGGGVGGGVGGIPCP